MAGRWARSVSTTQAPQVLAPVGAAAPASPPAALPTVTVQIPDWQYRMFSTGQKLLLLEMMETEVDTPLEQLAKRERTNIHMLLRIKADEGLRQIASSKVMQRTKNALMNKFYLVSDMALGHLDDARLSRLNGYQLAMVAAIALDKARLIEGQSTQNIQIKDMAMHIHTNLEELRARKAQIMELMSISKKAASAIPAEVVKTDAPPS